VSWLAGLYGIHAVANTLMAQGAPMKVVQPNPAFASADVIAAVAHSRPAKRRPGVSGLHDVAARPGHCWNGTGETASVIPGIPGSLDAKTMQPWDVFRYTPRVSARLQAEVRQALQGLSGPQPLTRAPLAYSKACSPANDTVTASPVTCRLGPDRVRHEQRHTAHVHDVVNLRAGVQHVDHAATLNGDVAWLEGGRVRGVQMQLLGADEQTQRALVVCQ